MSQDNKIQLTAQGLANLERELKELQEGKRPQAVERLATARAQGDLSENQEYINAKEDLNMMDGRISELEEVLARAIVVKADQGQGIGLGNKVTVEIDHQKMVYHLVGEWEADPAVQKISHKSPLGQKLIGKKVGDKVEVQAPAGKVVYKIVNIE